MCVCMGARVHVCLFVCMSLCVCTYVCEFTAQAIIYILIGYPHISPFNLVTVCSLFTLSCSLLFCNEVVFVFRNRYFAVTVYIAKSVC